MHEVHEENEAPQLPAEEAMHTQAELDVLCNQDLLKLLFEKLGRLALCSVGATCRQWRQVAASDEFWTSLDFTGLGTSPWQVSPCGVKFPAAACKHMCTLLSCSSSIHYACLSYLFGTQMVPLLRRHPNVQVLNLRGVPGGASLLQQDLLVLTRQDSLYRLLSCSISIQLQGDAVWSHSHT